jgi:hypothetical protein
LFLCVFAVNFTYVSQASCLPKSGVNVEAASLPLDQWLVEFEAVAAHFVFLWVSPVGSPNFRGQRPGYEPPLPRAAADKHTYRRYSPAEVWT